MLLWNMDFITEENCYEDIEFGDGVLPDDRGRDRCGACGGAGGVESDLRL